MAESPTESFEHAEHAEHVAHLGDRMLTLVSMTIAVLAVVAATVGSLETIETAATIGDKNQAVLLQNKASDTWAFFQAKSTKKDLFDIAAQQGGAHAEEFADRSKRYAGESKDIQEKARGLETQSEQSLERSETHEHRHHLLTIAVTLLHVSIAVATISIIVRRRWPWYASIALGIAGALGAAFAYV